MAKKMLTNIDLSGNQILSASFEKLTGDPVSGNFKGRMYFNTTANILKVYDGTSWGPIGDITNVEGTTNEVTVNVNSDGVATISLPSNIHVDVTGNLTGNASSATNADYATNAGSATNADYATSAGNASTADSATNANYATSAGNASTADYATSAGSATTAGSATNADYATSAGSATNADYATSAGSATNADYATSAGNATTADTANAVAANSVALGTDTTGDYVANLIAGTGIGIDYTSGEGSQPTVTNNGVVSISGTSDQIAVDFTTGDVTVSLPSAVTFPGTVTLNADPTTDLQAATKAYVDARVNGLTWKAAANVLAVSNVPLSGSTPLAIDSHTLSDGYRVVLTAQSTDAENGIYTLAISGGSYTLSRAADGDAYAELVGASIFIEEGTVYAKTSWVQANHYLTSFAGQEWYQISGQGTYTNGDGLSLTGGEFAVKLATAGGLKFNGSAEIEADDSYVAMLTGTQTLYSKTLSSPTILGPMYVQSGGGAGSLNNTITANNTSGALEISSTYGINIATTGGDIVLDPHVSAKVGSDVITTNTATQTLTNKTIDAPVITGSGIIFEGATADSFETLLEVVDPTADRTITLPNASGSVALKVTANVGNASATSFSVTHNFGTRDVHVQVFDNATYDTVECDVVRTNINTVTVSFAIAPDTNAYRVVVIG